MFGWLFVVICAFVCIGWGMFIAFGLFVVLLVCWCLKYGMFDEKQKNPIYTGKIIHILE